MNALSSQGQRASNRDIGLDAVRSLAIWLVMIGHGITNLIVPSPPYLDPEVYATGCIGVEVFFSLSGFLIGRILLDIEAMDVTTNLAGRFLIRRWMRTLPLYYVFLTMTVLIWPDARETLSAFLTMTQNLFSIEPKPNYFPQSWSLPIEELSYLLLPLLAFALRPLQRRPMATAGAILLVVALIYRATAEQQVAFWDVRIIAAGRLDAIVCGFFVALIERRYASFYRRCAPFLIPAAIASVLVHGALFSQPLELDNAYGRIFALPIFDLSVALLLPVVRRPSFGIKSLDWVFIHTSKLSYSLYIIHILAAATVHALLPTLPVFLLAIVYFAVSVITAALLSVLVEQPLMRLRPAQFPR
jgi:peptidoglycan/LPS O-acetylase OafA/YrhL